MRKVLLIILLLLCPALAHSGQGMGPGPGLSVYINYDTTDFETGMNGWSASSGSIQQQVNSVYSGAWSFETGGFNSSVPWSLTRSMTTAGGTVSAWLRMYGVSDAATVTFYVDGSPAGSASAVSGAWTQLTAPVSAGSHSLEIRATTSSTAQEWLFVDLIKVPVP